MRLVVVIASFGRRATLSRTLAHLSRQKRLPDLVLVSAPDESHVDLGTPCAYPVSYVFGSKGSCAQRNLALDHPECSNAGIAVFFDDDFVPADDYLEKVEAALAQRPDWGGLSGSLLADGVKGPGLSFEDAMVLLDRAPAADRSGLSGQVAWPGAYGCNMAFRGADIGAHRFDEALPLYGWLEDTDFSRRVADGRLIMRLDGLAGVHLGVKGGRTSGVRFGYSQIANPIYLTRKGTGTLTWAVCMVARNLLANFARSLWPEPHIDRVGRLKGNVIGLAHALTGRIDPRNIVGL
jgi:GT2 family glycosyltransferase